MIHDTRGREGAPGSTPGMGVIDVEMTLEAEKQLRNVSGYLALPGPPAMTGYEIHLGVTAGEGLVRSALHLSDGRPATASFQPTIKSSLPIAPRRFRPSGSVDRAARLGRHDEKPASRLWRP